MHAPGADAFGAQATWHGESAGLRGAARLHGDCLGYDRNGNLTSLTPPGQPAHTFTYDAIDQVSSYIAPSLGSGSSTTSTRSTSTAT